MAQIVNNLPAMQVRSLNQEGKSPGEVHGIPIQYSCLENPMDRGAWWATVHGVAKSQTRLKQHSTEYILIPLFAQRWAQNVFPFWNHHWLSPHTIPWPSVSSGMLWTSFSWHLYISTNKHKTEWFLFERLWAAWGQFMSFHLPVSSHQHNVWHLVSNQRYYSS